MWLMQMAEGQIWWLRSYLWSSNRFHRQQEEWHNNTRPVAVQRLRGQLRGAKTSFRPFRNTPFTMNSFRIWFHFWGRCFRIRILDCRCKPGYSTKAAQLVLASQYKISNINIVQTYNSKRNTKWKLWYYKWNNNIIIVVWLHIYYIHPGRSWE